LRDDTPAPVEVPVEVVIADELPEPDEPSSRYTEATVELQVLAGLRCARCFLLLPHECLGDITEFAAIRHAR
jgi:hypothetical protein